LKKQKEEKDRNIRYFDSTAKTTFVDQDMTSNTVGRRVMKTTDGGIISNN
jgi:hypothetical protein